MRKILKRLKKTNNKKIWRNRAMLSIYTHKIQ